MAIWCSFAFIPMTGSGFFPTSAIVLREQGWEVRELYPDRGQLDEVFRLLTTPQQAIS